MLRCGAVGVEYHVDLYGPMGGINGRLPSDRLVVEWDLVAERSIGTESVDVPVPPITADEIAAASPAAMDARVALRDSLVPLFAADGGRPASTGSAAPTP